MPRTVIVPLIRPEEDPDSASAAALPLAQLLAARLDADVVLVSVLNLPAEATEDGGQRLLHAADAFPDDERLVKLREQTEVMVAELDGYLQDVAEQFPAGRVEWFIRFGDAGQEVLTVAAAVSEPHVVMSSHAKRGFQRALVGSVAFKVVSEATFPVFVVPVKDVDEAPALQRLLVPLDGSLLAEYALDASLAVAGDTTLDVHLVQVIEPLTVRSGGVANDYYAMARDESQKYLERVAERLRARGCQTNWHVQLGLPAEQISGVAAEIDADLIVMATHGRSGLRRVILGSVAERVLHGTQRPLLLFRPTEEQLQASANASSAD